MVKIKPDQVDTYLKYLDIVSDELADLQKNYFSLDPETAPPDELIRMQTAYCFLRKEQQEIESSLSRVGAS